MIRESKSLSMAEAKEFVGENEIAETFIRKFTKMSPDEAKKMREKIVALNIIKVKQRHIAKIIDLMPENKEDLNKIFVDASLDDDESNKLLDVVKEFI